ncbi:UPF0280 family protein [Aestuariivita sp.]|jgi:ApbE superfamily uncharacterized protein (UPF0280 family)|uniref:UPF0280 family protein n=1 Tax=Aestuariivita sp. TaxID=1872407 RepID=UPI00216E03FE|nr:UPF0280 family protein [Aestuariivita sp.]MCE8006178.1 UPF0280 family protein [Aestuariivita sp.]
MGPTANLMPDGTRLHLQHGPIDLIIGAEGERQAAFEAATRRFATVLEELVAELPSLRGPMSASTPAPQGAIATRMHHAAVPFCETAYLTRMAAVAGSVADEVLHAMKDAADMSRAYVNNGGDIALHLAQGGRFTTAMHSHEGRELGRITITAEDPIRGIATSGRHGRSLSLGIADSVTVLAATAAQADVAATLIGNAVDLPGHPAIERRSANAITDDSDLGDRAVVIGCAPLSPADCQTALRSGKTRALAFQAKNMICAAGMFLQGQVMTTNEQMLTPQTPERLYG